MRKFTTLVAAIALLGLARTAAAGLTEITSTRYVLSDAEGGVVHDGPYQSNGPSPYGAFNNAAAESSAVDGNNGGTCGAYQTSSISPGLYTASLDTWASAFGDGSDFSSAYAQSHFEVKFTLTSTEAYSISGLAGAFGAINGETSKTTIKINNLGGGGTPTFLVFEETNDYLNFSSSGSLLPGMYSLTIDSLSIVDRTFESGFGDANAGVPNMTMTITPEPASLALMLVGGVLVIRRRR